jgi:hypothetical protein
MEKIEIKRDKKRIVRSLILGILSLLLIGVLIIIPREALVSHSDFGYWVLKIFSFIVLPLAIFSIYNDIRSLMSDKPWLVVDEFGIEQSMIRYQSGLIRWHDIARISVIPAFNCFMISIKLKNPEKYIHDEKLLVNFKKQTDKNPNEGEIRIVTNNFTSEQDKVIELMQKYLRESQQFDDFADKN